MTIDLAIPMFSGLLQKLGSPGSGMVGLENCLFNICCGERNVRIRLFPWDTNVEDVAESFWRYRPHNLQKYIIIGYSYGGQTAVNLCWALQRRGGCKVIELFLCDPVRRFSYFPGVAAGFGLGKLKVPSVSVQHIHLVRQRNKRWSFGRGILRAFRPAGHDVVGVPNEIVMKEVERTSGHSYIDNDLEFQNSVKDCVRFELKGIKGWV